MTSAHIKLQKECMRVVALYIQGTLSIAAVSLQALLFLFYGEGPAAVKLVHDRTPLESGEFLHALIVERCHAFRISFILPK
jgi:hypothetical protein